jgi:hypothetical protein
VKRASATRLVASVIGVEGGLLGLEHGYFELLQGDVAPGRLLINAIGPQAGVFVQRRHGGLVLILLSLVQLLVGGGLAPTYLGITAGVVASRIDQLPRPLARHLRERSRGERPGALRARTPFADHLFRVCVRHPETAREPPPGVRRAG